MRKAPEAYASEAALAPATKRVNVNSRHPARAVLALLAERYTDTTLRELAPLFGLTRADCVPHLIKRAAASMDSEIQIAIDKIEAQLFLSR